MFFCTLQVGILTHLHVERRITSKKKKKKMLSGLYIDGLQAADLGKCDRNPRI